MKRELCLHLGVKRTWAAVSIRNGEQQPEAVDWCKRHPGEGRWHFWTKLAIGCDGKSFTVDEFLFNREADAMLFALKFGS